jgi:dihydrodipicolinate synthase/N-acetylneuraminate lyase/uncharacterized protein YgbK (DUF1537 family)
MKDQFPRATPVSEVQVPVSLMADDATGADQLALAVVEILGKRVLTIDASLLSQPTPPLAEGFSRVINSRTRALSGKEAQVQNQFLATRVFAGERNIPVLQIDSRLRGIGNALRGIYEALDFEFLLFVPAEPELGRLVKDGAFNHVEHGRLTPFHQSALAKSVEPPLKTSTLRAFAATELGISTAQVYSINEEVVSRGPDALADFVRGLKQSGKIVVIPDVTGPNHFETINLAMKKLGRARILIAGSRTFLRCYFASFTVGKADTHHMKSLFQSIDRQKRGAPLAVISSLEVAMNSQIEFAQRALGPNLVTVSFDSSVVLKDDQTVQREIDRVQGVVLQSLKAMRPVLLQTSRTQLFAEPAAQQKQTDMLSKVVADEQIRRLMTALFISGGQTAETIKKALGISTVEIKGAFQKDVPWGVAVDGAFKQLPLVTKGGRLGSENVLFEFFEQGHPLPRANLLPVVTPMTKDKQVDEAGIERLIAHLVRLRTTDIFAVGNAGEFRFLTNDQRLQAIEIFARKARGKLRVFAGITGDTADETRKNYEAAGKLGVHAAVVMPLYFLKSSEEIVPFVESLAPIQPKLPLILYNNPERTNKQNIAFEAVEALDFPVVAIKDSSGDLDRFDRYARSMPVYEGQQRQILEGWQHGARGSIGIIGHVSSSPNEFYAPETTAMRREEIGQQINDLSKVAKQGGAEVAAYKYILSLAGIIGDTVASNEAVRELTDAQREQIRTANADLISKLRSAAGPRTNKPIPT